MIQLSRAGLRLDTTDADLAALEVVHAIVDAERGDEAHPQHGFVAG